jgi:16S rRNA (adenine1518-N6/adenine1519-N6)-dimethyltransferase
LTLFIAKKANVKEMLFVPKECFRPIPKVESSVLLFELHNDYDEIDDERFMEFIKTSFAEPRKKLVNNLVK